MGRTKDFAKQLMTKMLKIAAMAMAAAFIFGRRPVPAVSCFHCPTTSTVLILQVLKRPVKLFTIYASPVVAI